MYTPLYDIWCSYPNEASEMTDKKDYPSMGAQLTEDQIKQLNTTGVAYAKVEELTPDQHAAVKTAIDSAAQAAEHPGYAGLDGLVRLQKELDEHGQRRLDVIGKTQFSQNYQPHPDQSRINTELVQMAIMDFLGFLTTRDEVITLSARHDASPAVEAFKDWVGKKQLVDYSSMAQDESSPTMENWDQHLMHVAKGNNDAQ
ncbi:hypothetical protein Illi2_00097 [Pseudomonas phage vB_PpuM-Illi-2]